MNLLHRLAEIAPPGAALAAWLAGELLLSRCGDDGLEARLRR
jgi:hypothetical protein